MYKMFALVISQALSSKLSWVLLCVYRSAVIFSEQSILMSYFLQI